MLSNATSLYEPIREAWDELLRLIATIEQRWRSATAVLERFGADARGDRIYWAGHALGQLQRTVYLCDYSVQKGLLRQNAHIKHEQ